MTTAAERRNVLPSDSDAILNALPNPVVLIGPDGKTAYVSCDASSQVAVINTADWTVQKMIDAGKGADGLAWAR